MKKTPLKIVRYPGNQRVVQIDPDLPEHVAKLLSHPSPVVRLQELKQERHGWMFQGAPPETTWYWLINEIVHPSRFVTAEARKSFLDALWEVLATCVENRGQLDPWPAVRTTILSKIEDLSGWAHCYQRAIHDKESIYRRDGRTYYEKDGEEVEIIGAQTGEEDRWDYICDAALGGHKPLYQLLRMCALFWTCECAEDQPEVLPKSLQIVLPENGSYSGFQYWYWVVSTPGEYRRVEWHPNLAHCNPSWLANDLIANLSEIEEYSEPEFFGSPSTDVALRAEAEIAKYPYQVEFAVDTPVILLGDDVHLFDWQGTPVRWINQTANRHASLTIPCRNPNDMTPGFRTGMEFLGAFSFVTKQSARVVTWIGSGPAGGTALVQSKRNPGAIGLNVDISEYWKLDGRKRNLGLAFFREGMSSGSIYYSFLSFWKVIQLAFNEEGKSIKRWVTENIVSVRDPHVQRRVKEISDDGKDLGRYLWESCRCAIAHASVDPVVDPDDLVDYKRIQHDLSIAAELARLIINSNLLDGN